MKYIVLLLAVVTCSCASGPKERPLKERLQSHVGQTADALVAQLGQYDRIDPSYNGNKILVYVVKTNFTSDPIGASERATYSRKGSKIIEVREPAESSQTVELFCNTYYEINSANVVVAARAKGNHCPD